MSQRAPILRSLRTRRECPVDPLAHPVQSDWRMLDGCTDHCHNEESLYHGCVSCDIVASCVTHYFKVQIRVVFLEFCISHSIDYWQQQLLGTSIETGSEAHCICYSVSTWGKAAGVWRHPLVPGGNINNKLSPTLLFPLVPSWLDTSLSTGIALFTNSRLFTWL
jgi:hypothetical protein